MVRRRRPGDAESDSEAEEDEEDDDASESDAEDERVVAIDRCLNRPWKTRRRIAREFRKFSIVTDGGIRALSPTGWNDMMVSLSQELGVPESLFANGQQLYERFDFDGDGLLEKFEVVKLVKYVLRQRRNELGGRAAAISVPESTLVEEGYTVLKELGRGGQGAMYLCSKTMTAHRYCVKFYNKQDANACGLNELISEYALMKALASEYIAQTYHVFQDTDFYYLVNEPYFGGDFTKLAKRAHEEGLPLSEAWWRPIFRQCLEGLAYLHRKAIMHCDIKEPNIMIAAGDSYEAPRPVLIDFGLSVPFSKAEGGISGTPGYIPPETWQTGHWYPAGDIYSLGVVFFQLMSGQVPSSTGSVMGVLQPAADINQLRRAGLAAMLPWHKFPTAMPQLRDLVVNMTQRERRNRLREPTALSHAWFKAASDAPLPEGSLRGLLGAGAGHRAAEAVVQGLVKDNNLDELRGFRSSLHEQPRGPGEALRSAGRRLRSFLTHHEVDDATPNGRRRLLRMLDEAIWAKLLYNHHYIKDLFNELDRDGDGCLDASELQVLLDSDAFECPADDVRDLMAEMHANKFGKVSYENFKRAVLEDGRIARRTDSERRGVPCCVN